MGGAVPCCSKLLACDLSKSSSLSGRLERQRLQCTMTSNQSALTFYRASSHARLQSAVAHRFAPHLRSFHSTGPRSSQFLDSCCLHMHDVVAGFHVGTGLPWGITIPLTALLMRTVFVLPMSAWTRRQSQKAASTRALNYAWAPIIQHRIKQQYAVRGPNFCKARAKVDMKALSRELFAAAGVKRWVAWLPFLQLPLWLLPMETLRRMCGTKEGLLSYIFSLFAGEESTTDIAAVEAAKVQVEASFASEGILWFPDLLAPDPMLLLPFMLTGALFWNLGRLQKQFSNEDIQIPKRSLYLQRGMRAATLLIPWLTLQTPSALLLYWTSSACVGLAHNFIIDRALPLPRTPKPCRPPQSNYVQGLGKL